MKLADIMDKVEVGMKMVVRSEYNPKYDIFGGKVVEKKGVYLCLEVDGILHGMSAKEGYEVLKLYDKNGTDLFEQEAWATLQKYIPKSTEPENIFLAALDLWGCYTFEVKKKVASALFEVMINDDIEWTFDKLSDKHRQIANLLGYEDYCESIDEETDINEEFGVDKEPDSNDYDPDAYEEDGTEEELYLNESVCKKLLEIQAMLQNKKQKESVNA